jgi:hypothetical protein
MSDWGQGAKNNNIGWGQGAVNNDIGWGSVHENSWSGDTDIVGLDPIETIINAFEERVALDGGTFEAESCLNTTLTDLNNDGLLEQASLVITPNAVEEGKLFSIVPDDGSGDLSVVRATTKTRVNSLGVIESVPMNVAALDYTDSTCPSILVEPQRTNLVLRSEEFDNVAWSKINATVTANTIVSPDGTQNADKFVENNGTGTKWIYNVPTVISGSVYTYSVFAKKGERDFIYINAFSSGNRRAWFNLNTGTIGTTDVGASAKIENYVNGWYRCSVTFTAASGTNFYLLGVSNANNVENYTGDGTSGIYIWGAQNELGTNATSYIPTVASAVTRNADVISKTGISSLIGQTEGTLFFDGIVNSIQNSGTNILNTNKNPSVASQIALTKVSSTNKIRFEQFFGNGGFGNIRLESTNTFANGTRTKVAIRYKSGNFAMYINGVLEATSSSTFTNIGTKSDLFLNDSATLYAFQGSVSFNSVALWKETLNNTELAQLTTI